MIKTEKLEKMIELCIASGYIRDETAPLSLILIGNPESAKTKMIQKFQDKFSLETSDLSARPITEVIIPKLERNELHHLVIPDFIKVLAHKNTTVHSTLTFLNAIIEEGIKQQLFFGQSFQLKERRKCGIITSLTYDYFYKVFRMMHQMGFTSRCLICSFKLSDETIREVHHNIARNIFFEEVIKMKKITRKKIIIPNDISDKLNFVVQEILKNQLQDNLRIRMKGGQQKRIPIEFMGFRLHRQIRKLLQTITLLNGRTITTWGELNDELLPIVDYIRLPKNPKII